jgi:UDPglucose--hexose-1-phosphate uridylyltransferase
MAMDFRTLMRDSPHRRYNALSGEWLLVSPHRAKRPWQGQTEKTAAIYRPPYAADCYLCPGNPRAGNVRNPVYTGTFVFTNDFPALLESETEPWETDEASGLFRAVGVTGTCRVLCFSPRHDLTLAEMDLKAIARVVDVWAEQIEELGRRYRWVQVFENKGAIMGCSNPHPHGQIWATDYLPNEPAAEDAQQRDYAARHGRPLLMDYARAEEEAGERIVVGNDDWLVVVPWWAMWPFETIVLPRRRQILRLPELEPSERMSLSSIIKDLLKRYDRLFNTSFPYTMGWHGAPTGGTTDVGHWQLHAHYYPPLLRSATVRKFMVGFEMLAEAQRDITPEQAAERLRG